MDRNKSQPMTFEVIVRHLQDVASELNANGENIDVVIAGGSLMAFLGLRESTVDIDSVSQLSVELQDAAARVAERYGLSDNWLNSNASAFAPEVIRSSEFQIVFEKGRLRVFGLSSEQLFLMKMNSNRRRDHEDLLVLWPKISFQTARETVEQYWLAYPHAHVDEFLESWIDQIISIAEKK